MDSKHTPGPWSLNEEGRPMGADGQMVGEMSALTPFTVEEHARIGADRQLMTAAPELLEAARFSLRYFEQVLAESGGKYACDGEVIAHEAAKAAITKATGETP